MEYRNCPPPQGMYHPGFEHDACGIGMLADIKGRRSHGLVSNAIEVLCRLTHRGGAGCEEETGDGAGLLIQIPWAFFAAVAGGQGVELPEKGGYGVAMVFASPEKGRAQASLKALCNILEQEGMCPLWVRRVPVNPASIGRTAAGVCPSIRQVFIPKPAGASNAAFERALYLVSKIATQQIRHAEKDADPYFYLASCSAKTIVYKGMLLPRQLAAFYLDLMDRRLASAIALVHSRFSTNTFPSWERAHPQRLLIHNGEINTIRGNVKWVRARQKALPPGVFGDDLARIGPIIDEDGSDSAMLDDYIRFLVNGGYSLPHAMAMAVPEPYEQAPEMDAGRRAFYEYHNCLGEPWDGPAALAFTDGVLCGAMLDRNGLRPARYTITADDVLVLASEAGVLDIPAGRVAQKGRLRPGQMLLVDTEKGALIDDSALKAGLAAARPYGEWLSRQMKRLEALPAAEEALDMHALRGLAGVGQKLTLSEKQQMKAFEKGAFAARPGQALAPAQRQRLFGYSWEDVTLTVRGMAETHEDPIGAMGTDTPLAVLSRQPQLLYSYFKQLFAQVTNPPIDALREKVVTSTSVLLGGEGSLLQPDEFACRAIKLDSPVLSPEQLEHIRRLNAGAFCAVCLPMLFEPRPGRLEKALDDLFTAADLALQSGASILVLSDEAAGGEYAPIPALLATGGLHQHLVAKGTRTRCSIVVAAGDAWESHHLAALVGYGASAVCPWMAYAVLEDLARRDLLEIPLAEARQSYREAATKSIVKIMGKMGISTVRSYHGAQVFEALGLGQAVVDRYFTGTVTRIGGLGLAEIEAEALERHRTAMAAQAGAALPEGGQYRWRKQGEYHLYNPENIFYLQQACRSGDYELFKTYSAAVNKRSEQLKNIRGLLDIRQAEKPLPLDTVEAAESIVKRFKTGAMSYGSISREAHECMAIAMNRLGGKSNTGEGGEEAARFAPNANGDDRCSAIKQVASGRFGVTIEYLNHAREIQIKMAQGAKPGEGGHLPGKKVYPWIAKSRHATPGVELISPPPHHDIYSIEDLAQLIHDLKSANPRAAISVKLVSEAGVGTVAVGVAKGLADVIVVSGYDGGTGAAPRTSIRHAGLPWELGVAEAHQTLLLNGLRNRVKLETDGKLLTGRDVVVAALLGAEEFAFATAPLVALGCDMMRVCNLDTCPVGIATQNPELRARFCGRPEYVENLMLFLAREVREWMSRIGVRRFEDLIGRTELLRQHHTDFSAKAKTVDLSALLYQPKASDTAGERMFTLPQRHHLGQCFDEAVLLPLCRPAIEEGRPVEYALPLTNQNRTVGCRLSGVIAQKHGAAGLPQDTIRLSFAGSAGQSFGAFLTSGVSLHLAGDANDYLGKGLCGGRISLAPPEALAERAHSQIIAGNVAFFGATGGEGYVCGAAGERFCVRNSGARVVVEGVGDHGCEYMTGGVVLVLGGVGRNFAAGMSGGVAYLLDPDGTSRRRCNLDKARLYGLDEGDRALLQTMLENHLRYTGSRQAASLLEELEAGWAHFVKLIPCDYKKVMDTLRSARLQALADEERLLAAFNAVIA